MIDHEDHDNNYENESDFEVIVGDNFVDEKERLEEKNKKEEEELDMANNIIKKARRLHKNNNAGTQKFGNFVATSSDKVADLQKTTQLDARLNDIIEKVGLYENMSTSAIDALKKRIVNEPPSVLEGLKEYYNQKIEPVLQRREKMLAEQIQRINRQKEINKDPSKVSIFLYVSASERDDEDGAFKEKEKFVSVDVSKRPGFEIYNGQIVQQMRPDQTPFSSPDVLFAPKESTLDEVVPKQEAVKNNTPKIGM